MSSNNSQPPSPPNSPFGGPTSHAPSQAPMGPPPPPMGGYTPLQTAGVPNTPFARMYSERSGAARTLPQTPIANVYRAAQEIGTAINNEAYGRNGTGPNGYGPSQLYMGNFQNAPQLIQKAQQATAHIADPAERQREYEQHIYHTARLKESMQLTAPIDMPGGQQSQFFRNKREAFQTAHIYAQPHFQATLEDQIYQTIMQGAETIPRISHRQYLQVAGGDPNQAQLNKIQGYLHQQRKNPTASPLGGFARPIFSNIASLDLQDGVPQGRTPEQHIEAQLRASIRNSVRDSPIGQFGSEINASPFLSSMNVEMQQMSVGEIMASRGRELAIRDIENDPSADPRLKQNATPAVARAAVGTLQGQAAEVANVSFPYAEGVPLSAALPLASETVQTIENVRGTVARRVGEQALYETASSVPMQGGGGAGGGAGGAGGFGGGAGDGGDDPMKRLTEGLAQVVSELMSSLQKASQGAEGFAQAMGEAQSLPSPDGSASAPAPSAAPMDTEAIQKELQQTGRREFRLFDKMLARGGTLEPNKYLAAGLSGGAGAIGFMRGVFGRGVFQSDSEAAKVGNVLGAGTAALSRTMLNSLVGLTSAGGGADIAGFYAGVPGYERGLQGLGLLNSYAQSASQAELPAMQAQALMGQAPSSFGGFASRNVADFMRLGIGPEQAAQMLQQAASIQGGAVGNMQSLRNTVLDFTAAGYDPNAYLGNLAQQRSFGFTDNQALEFNVARGLGLTGSAATNMQAQLFGNFLGASAQNLGITRQGYYERVLGMGRGNLTQGAAVFARGQGVAAQAGQMLSQPYAGLAPTLMLSEALRRTGGDQVAATRLLERVQAQGGAGINSLLSSLPADVRRMALASSGLNLRDQVSINQSADFSSSLGDTPNIPQIDATEGMQVNRELSKTLYGRTATLYSDIGMDRFRAAQGQNRRIEAFQTGERLDATLGKGLGDAAKQLGSMTSSVMEVTKALDLVAKTVRDNYTPLITQGFQSFNAGNTFTAAGYMTAAASISFLLSKIGFNPNDF